MTIKDIKIGDIIDIPKGVKFVFSTNNITKDIAKETLEQLQALSEDDIDFEDKNVKILKIQDNYVYFDDVDYKGNIPFVTTFEELNRIGAFKNIKTNTMEYKVGDKFSLSGKIPYTTENNKTTSFDSDLSGINRNSYTIKKINKTVILFDTEAGTCNFYRAKKADFEKYAIFENKEQMKEERKIIGYTLLKDVPGVKANTSSKIWANYSWIFNNIPFTPAQVYDTEWFSPIYEDEFKVGDYIALTKNPTGWASSLPLGTILKIEKEKTRYHGGLMFTVSLNNKAIGGLDDGHYRKATEAEIKAYKEERSLIKNLGANNITLKWDGDNKLEVVEIPDKFLHLDRLMKYYYTLVGGNSGGDYDINVKDYSARIFLVGCVGQGNYVSLNEIKKVIDFCNAK